MSLFKHLVLVVIVVLSALSVLLVGVSLSTPYWYHVSIRGPQGLLSSTLSVGVFQTIEETATVQSPPPSTKKPTPIPAPVTPAPVPTATNATTAASFNVTNATTPAPVTSVPQTPAPVTKVPQTSLPFACGITDRKKKEDALQAVSVVGVAASGLTLLMASIACWVVVLEEQQRGFTIAASIFAFLSFGGNLATVLLFVNVMGTYICDKSMCDYVTASPSGHTCTNDFILGFFMMIVATIFMFVAMLLSLYQIFVSSREEPNDVPSSVTVEMSGRFLPSEGNLCEVCSAHLGDKSESNICVHCAEEGLDSFDVSRVKGLRLTSDGTVPYTVPNVADPPTIYLHFEPAPVLWTDDKPRRRAFREIAKRVPPPPTRVTPVFPSFDTRQLRAFRDPGWQAAQRGVCSHSHEIPSVFDALHFPGTHSLY